MAVSAIDEDELVAAFQNGEARAELRQLVGEVVALELYCGRVIRGESRTSPLQALVHIQEATRAALSRVTAVETTGRSSGGHDREEREHPTATSSAPERSLQQRMEALKRANAIRSRRAELKRDLKAAKADPVALVVDPIQEIETMKVFDLIMAMPKVGRVKANKVLQQCRISPSKTIGGLSPRQRHEIVSQLPAAYRP
jgi:hypothetical protein